jgi:hypothetical protein
MRNVSLCAHLLHRIRIVYSKLFREQIKSERHEMERELTAAYYACVRTAFASQRRTMVDRNAAIDQVFMVCKPEETKLQAFEEGRSENPNVGNAAIVAHRNRLKEELLR